MHEPKSAATGADAAGADGEATVVAVECDEQECELEVETVIESNTLCSLFVLVSAVVLDALCALPGAVLDDVPASLRTTSLTLVVLLGAPSVSKSRFFLMEQRLLLAAMLSTAACVGLNRAEPAARNADALFSLVGALACVAACTTNGATVKNGSTAAKRGELREHLTAFYGAFCFYLGVRVVRHAIALPSEVLSFSVSHVDVDTRGYAVANELTVVGLSFSGAVVAAFGVVALLNHDLVLHMGSRALSNVAGMLACFAFLGALAAQLSAYSQLDRLPALFGPNACDGPYSECEAAFRARRLFSSSTSTSTAWACVASLATFSFCCSKRARTRKDHFLFWPDLYSPPYVAMLFASAASLVVVASFVDSDANMHWADVELLLLVCSIPIVLLNFPILGCACHLAAQTVYVATRFSQFGHYDLRFFTHWSILATALFTVLIILGSSTSYFLYVFEDQRLYWEGLERATAVCIVALLSVQAFLTIGTSGMSSGYTGIFYENAKSSWRTAGYEFCVQHNISLFFAAALFAVRYEHHALSRYALRAAWFSPPIVVGVAWIARVAFLTDDGSPYGAFVDFASFLIGVSAATVSWLGVGIFVNA